MKSLILVLILVSLVFVVSANAQVSNLIVYGSSSYFEVVTGDSISWSYNVNPAGSTATCELWLDVDSSGTIDTTIDKNRFVFTQTDGVSGGDNGPGDNDGTANGHIEFWQATGIGLPPGNYVFKVTQGGSSETVRGHIYHLSSPAHTVSGQVFPPSGKSAANIFVEVRPGQGHDKFWEAVTNSSGVFNIQTDADTAGNPWKLRLADNYNPFPGYVLTPAEYSFTLDGNPGGYNFTFGASAAKVTGILKDDDGAAITSWGVNLNRTDGSSFNINTNTDAEGHFSLGLAVSDLSANDFQLNSDFNSNDPSPAFIQATKTIHGISNHDSLFYNLVAYKVNSSIQGLVKINGSVPDMKIQVSGSVVDSGWSQTWSDSATGSFSLPVSNKLYNYNMWCNSLPNNYYVTGITAHPGQTGVIINITVTDVIERESGIPSTFALGQNYPNPFNPTTTINYDLPKAAHVKLDIYNILGEHVFGLVNQEQPAGKYKATLDAASFPSGVYLYRLTAGTFSETKKFMLMK